jgi:solute carrier family 25 citrate transporter 1
MGKAVGTKQHGPVVTFGKGLLTGTIEAVICYPTELVKTTLQLQSKSNPQYKGMVDCGKQVFAKHGIRGLYAGAAPLLVGSSGKQAARWTAYTTAADYMRDKNGKLSVGANMLAGVCAGTSEAICAVTPMETIKTRVADAQRSGSGQYKGSLDATIKILKKEGPMGIYRGVVPTILKQSTNQAVRFPVQSFFMGVLVGDDKVKRANPLYNGFAGALAGGVSVLVTMPQDTVKTRMQGEDAKKLYKGTVDCFKTILRTEGPAFFFSGTLPRLVRVSLDVGITFTIFPLLGQLFDKYL